MKKQIVAILAIIAVITTLFTVGALSNEVGYKLSPCDAIDISLQNATVQDFLDNHDMSTAQAYNYKDYRGINCWMVQWSSTAALSAEERVNVYVDAVSGNIIDVEERGKKTRHYLLTFSGAENKTSPIFNISGEIVLVCKNITTKQGSHIMNTSIYREGGTECVYTREHHGMGIGSTRPGFIWSTMGIKVTRGAYYVSVNSNYVEWEIEIYDYY